MEATVQSLKIKLSLSDFRLLQIININFFTFQPTMIFTCGNDLKVNTEQTKTKEVGEKKQRLSPAEMISK